MSWGEGNERLTGNFATKMTLDMITAFQRDTSLPKLKSETSCCSEKQQNEGEDVESHLGGVGVGGLRRGVDLHGLVDAKALLRGEHPHKSSSKPLSFSLSLWTHLTAEAAAVQDYKPETFFLMKNGCLRCSRKLARWRRKQIGPEYLEPEKGSWNNSSDNFQSTA